MMLFIDFYTEREFYRHTALKLRHLKIFFDFWKFGDFADLGAVCTNSDKGPAPPSAARGRAPAALARGCRGSGYGYFSAEQNSSECIK